MRRTSESQRVDWELNLQSTYPESLQNNMQTVGYAKIDIEIEITVVKIGISTNDGYLPRRLDLMTDYRVHAGEAQEDQVTAAIEKYTSQIPSSAYLGLAIASIAASITLQLTQKEKAPAALFVGQWVAPFLLLGIYNKMVKQHGSDAVVR